MAAPNLRNGQGHNSGPTVFSDDTHEAGVLITAAWDIIAGVRPHGGAWSTFRLGQLAGNPMGVPVDSADGHQHLSVLLDADGHIWIVGNERNGTRMVRSAAPYSVTSGWTTVYTPAQPLTDLLPGEYDLGSYDYFERMPDGTGLFLSNQMNGPDGQPRNLLWILRTLAPGASTWQRHAMLAATFSHTTVPSDPDWIYIRHIYVDQFGVVWCVGAVRHDQTNVATQTDVYCIRSTDNLATWETVSGAPITLPLTYTQLVNAANCRVSSTVQSERQSNIAVDDQGRPHFASRSTSGDGTRFWWDGAAWQSSTDIHGKVAFLGTLGWARKRLWVIGRKDTKLQAVSLVPDDGRITNFGGLTASPVYEPKLDPHRHRQGILAPMFPNGDEPRTMQYGGGPRRRGGTSPAVVPLSIDSTGTTDTAADLTAWFSTLDPSITTVQFQPGGVYNVNDGTVDLANLSGVTVDLNGAEIRRTRLLDIDKRWPKNYPWLRPTDCTNVTVSGGSISGLNIGDPNVYGAHLDGFTHGGTPGYVEITPPTPGYEDLVYFPTSDLRWGEHVPGADNIDPADPWWGPGVAAFPGAGWYLLATQHDPQNPNQWSRWQEPTMTSVPGTKADHGAYCEALAFEHGIHLEGGSGVTVEDVTMVGVGGDYVFCRGATGLGHTIRNISNGRRNGRQGFALISGGPYLIEDCDNTWSRRAWLDLEADQATQTLHDVEVRNNLGCVAHNLWIANQGDGGLSGLYAHDNQIERSSTPLVWIASNPASSGNALRPRSYYRRFNIRIEDNLWESPALPGGQAGQHASGSLPTVVLDNVEGATVARNTFPRQSGSSGPLVGTRYWPSADLAIYDNPLGNHGAVFTDQVVGEPDKWAWAESTAYQGYTGVVFDPPTTWTNTDPGAGLVAANVEENV